MSSERNIRPVELGRTWLVRRWDRLIDSGGIGRCLLHCSAAQFIITRFVYEFPRVSAAVQLVPRPNSKRHHLSFSITIMYRLIRHTRGLNFPRAQGPHYQRLPWHDPMIPSIALASVAKM